MIRIDRAPWREMVNHAQAAYPNECCGAMIGSIDGDDKIGARAIEAALDERKKGAIKVPAPDARPAKALASSSADATEPSSA